MIAVSLFVAAAAAFADADSRETLKPLQPLVGSWKSTSTPLDRNGRRGRDFTRTTSVWAWKIDREDARLAWKLAEGKPFRSGVLSFDSTTDRYVLELERPDGTKLAFAGKKKGAGLELDGADGSTAEKQRVQLEIVGDNRFTLVFSAKSGERWRKTQEIGNTREGVTFAAKTSGPECIVTGGLGTTPVTYKGRTYYVCCSGCKQAFEEDPEKYIAESKGKKK